jgi:CRP-like cAMP-binding protein
VAVTRGGRRINALGPGCFFGELAAMNPGPRNATVTALSEVDVLIIGPREFAATANIPGFRDALFQSMARRLQEADAQIAEVADQQERPLANTNEKLDAPCRRGPERSAPDKATTSPSLAPRSHRRWE